MIALLRPALVLFITLSLICGIAYPLAVTGIAQTFFPHEANGSLIGKDGMPADPSTPPGSIAGSSLIGQDFASGSPQETAGYLWGRLSATGPVPYTSFNSDAATGSSGSNLAPTNPALTSNAQARIKALAEADAAVGLVRSSAPIPVDLVTASASGLDPHISIAAAEYQLPRIARARSMSEDALRTLIQRHTRGRTLGLLGEPTVNVLEVNLALDALPARVPRTP